MRKRKRGAHGAGRARYPPIYKQVSLAGKISGTGKTFKVYGRFNLSILGKITVIKILGVPKLVYLMSVLPDPDRHTYKKIEMLIRNFL